MKRKSKDAAAPTPTLPFKDESIKVVLTDLHGGEHPMYLYPKDRRVFTDPNDGRYEHFEITHDPDGSIQLRMLAPFAYIPPDIRHWAAKQEISSMTLAEVLAATATKKEPAS